MDFCGFLDLCFFILASNLLLLAMVWEQEHEGYGGIVDGMTEGGCLEGFKDECL